MTTKSEQPTEARVPSVSQQMLSRRAILGRAATLGLAAAGATLLGGPALAQSGSIDVDVLNFALNLEYLEAEYYTYATTGQSIQALGVPINGAGDEDGVLIKPNPQVPFQTPLIQQFAEEIAQDERDHVLFLRHAIRELGAEPVAQPQLDLWTSFDVAAEAAGIGDTFDPFANEVNFLIGAFIFEDVGVTAYRGAESLLTGATIISDAAGILGTEAYHAAGIRTLLLMQGMAVAEIVQKISDLRDYLDRDGDDDQGILLNGMVNITPTDRHGLVYSRTARQVLNIVYFDPTSKDHDGGFFPEGLNGAIS